MKSTADANKNSGYYEAITLIRKAYLGTMILGCLGYALVGIIPALQDWPLYDKKIIPLSNIPIFLTHFFIYINSHSCYENYVIYWDKNQADRIASFLLWLLHPVTLVISAIFPDWWLLFLSVLILGIYLKNILALRGTPSDSPTRPILELWVRRSRSHLLKTIIIALIYVVLSLPGFYSHFLDIDTTNNDVIKMIGFIKLLISMIITAFVAITSTYRVTVNFADPLRTMSIKEYHEALDEFESKK